MTPCSSVAFRYGSIRDCKYLNLLLQLGPPGLGAPGIPGEFPRSRGRELSRTSCSTYHATSGEVGPSRPTSRRLARPLALFSSWRPGRRPGFRPTIFDFPDLFSREALIARLIFQYATDGSLALRQNPVIGHKSERSPSGEFECPVRRCP